MKTMSIILEVIPSVIAVGSNADGMNSPVWYLIGAILSILLLAYLIYALIKPEKF